MNAHLLLTYLLTLPTYLPSTYVLALSLLIKVVYTLSGLGLLLPKSHASRVLKSYLLLLNLSSKVLAALKPTTTLK